MLSFPVPRSQPDGLQLVYSQATALDMSESKDLARQEFRDEADINIILKKFGVTSHGITPRFQEVDYDADLQSALGAIAEARRVHADIDPELRKKYPTWQSLLNAMATGELTMKDPAAPVVSDPPPAEPPA